MERFVELKVRGINLNAVFAEILSRYLSQQCLLLSTIKERPLHSRKSFRGTLENRKNSEDLAQQIFHGYNNYLWHIANSHKHEA